jgi:hypothetical protein
MPKVSLEAERGAAMDPILKSFETTLTNSSLAARICVTTIVMVATLCIVMHLGMKVGEALYYVTH